MRASTVGVLVIVVGASVACSETTLTEYDVGSVRVSYPVGWTVRTVSPTEVVFEDRSADFGGHPIGEQLTVSRVPKAESAKVAFESGGGSHVTTYSVSMKERGYRLLLEHHCHTDGCPDARGERKRMTGLVERVAATAKP